ncbi:hypothetical protein QR680_007956 [Steinernema hermaphroditum]|uniref:Uncharacterized protein n=1 Tax=Steinernema hermaphroditum TaxID=289476 RepID=A0AA39IET6_9BILA|nr:hypothetical protein QR680_007956 [Steinernema hermaphroditum]
MTGDEAFPRTSSTIKGSIDCLSCGHTSRMLRLSPKTLKICDILFACLTLLSAGVIFALDVRNTAVFWPRYGNHSPNTVIAASSVAVALFIVVAYAFSWFAVGFRYGRFITFAVWLTGVVLMVVNAILIAIYWKALALLYLLGPFCQLIALAYFVVTLNQKPFQNKASPAKDLVDVSYESSFEEEAKSDQLKI